MLRQICFISFLQQKGLNLPHKLTDSWKIKYWLPTQLPVGCSVWCFKIVHIKFRNHYSSTQFPSNLTLRLILRGRGRVKIAGKEYAVEARGMFCAFPTRQLSFECNVDDPWEWLEIQLTGDSAGRFVNELGFSEQAPCLELADWRCAHLIRAMSVYFSQPQRCAYHGVSLLYEIAHACASNSVGANAYSQQGAHERIIAACELAIKSQMNFTMNVNDLAKAVGVERSTLQRAFREKMDTTPSEYIKDCRLYLAEELLGTTKMKVKLVARYAGFDNEKYFITWFKKLKGITPAAWRCERDKR